LLIIYKIVTFLIYYVTLPFTFAASISGSIKWKQRLGKGHKAAGGDHIDVWLHASSMGEVKVLGILLDRLREKSPSLKIYLSVMTDTGYNKALELADDNTSVGYFPLDYISSIGRFLGSVRPQTAVFIETEIWPNMIIALGRRNIPVILANGRLSEKAYRRYRKIKSGMMHILGNYTHLMVQSAHDRERYVGIGADINKVEVTGNLKFDAPIEKVSEEKICQLKEILPFDPDAKIFIAGSTRNGENEIILDCYKGLLAEFKNVRLILVPRHLDKINDIEKMAEDRRLEYCLYSRMEQINNECRVLIVDMIGVLNELYSVSDIAFVGGTLVNIGGHNILEPVWAGIPVLYGPSIANVVDSSDYILAENYGARIEDGNDLLNKLMMYFKGDVEFKKKAAGTAETSRANQTAQKILNCLNLDAKALAENNKL